MTPEDIYISTQTAMAELALSGCTTASDHLYLFPNGSKLDDEIEGARQVGLRFHALHHLFPSLPYHNLAKAHRRLMKELPANSPYRLTESPSLTASLAELWRNSRAAGRRANRLRSSTSPPPVSGQSLTGAH